MAQKTRKTGSSQKATETTPEKPPLSAEDFGHVLRRLIAEKATKSSEKVQESGR